METIVTEVADGIYQLATYIEAADLRFNQYLILADEPLLFHCGQRRLFSSVSSALAQVLPPAKLRWVSYGHFEADECGAMNDWLCAAPCATVAVGRIGCMLSAVDQAIRPPRALADHEVLDLGGKRVRYLATPHVPHCWDAGVLYEETTGTLLCGDLFTQMGNGPALVDGDIVAAALASEDHHHSTALTPQTAPTIRALAQYQPKALALMHGPVFHGDGAAALRVLADGYAERFTAAIAHAG
ncbi:MAG: MBL fold metallo-hydrolase [Rhodanobacter sp.]|nr:MAG: MBL fold metallo-hydrolase [Rhodanobacter sp.]TAM14621.1 MAG: MBL fold metallo-hydrolase [Rhodanobacter sp.]TAM37413.1 MAG: MBL fold metallo-hydrolase [Rhodanobacter sp.]